MRAAAPSSPRPPEGALVPVREAARGVGVATGVVYELIELGRLRPYRDTWGRMVVSPAALIDLLHR